MLFVVILFWIQTYGSVHTAFTAPVKKEPLNISGGHSSLILYPTTRARRTSFFQAGTYLFTDHFPHGICIILRTVYRYAGCADKLCI